MTALLTLLSVSYLTGSNYFTSNIVRQQKFLSQMMEKLLIEPKQVCFFYTNSYVNVAVFIRRVYLYIVGFSSVISHARVELPLLF